ncbi:MAG TPA: fluoride efflux transporter CrcB [Vicingaceae bacterium]|nr:fluoride efflux transporter CrcB [Vicingaceae bacterium]
MLQIALLFLAGGLGTLCRYGISKATLSMVATNFPLGTFISNILSCIILALTLVYFNGKFLENSLAKLVIITGFCGGFSTFSTFSYETVELLKQGNVTWAVSNILISVLVGVGLIYFLLIKDKI